MNNKRSSSCGRKDFFSLIRFSRKQYDHQQPLNNHRSTILRHESLDRRNYINANRMEMGLLENIFGLVEKEEFDNCIPYVRALSPEQVDIIAGEIPVSLILKKIPKSLKLIETLYSKNVKYSTDKNQVGLINTMPPDVLLNRLLAWTYSLENQKKSKTFQNNKQLLVKILKHIFTSSPALRNKLTKKLISLERSLDSATRKGILNPLSTIHPLLLDPPREEPTLVPESAESAQFNDSGERMLDMEWKKRVEKLKQDFLATFRLLEKVGQHSLGNHDSEITIEMIEKRLYKHRRMLDAVEPLESIVTHVTEQLRRSMETDKEVIFNCIQLSKELGLPLQTAAQVKESSVPKRPLSTTLSVPLMPSTEAALPVQQTHSYPPFSSAPLSIQVPAISSQQYVLHSPPPAPISTFRVVPFLSSLVKSYSKIVALITDDQLGPRVVFSTNIEDTGNSRRALSSRSFNEFTSRSSDNNNSNSNSGNTNSINKTARPTRCHTLPRSNKTKSGPEENRDNPQPYGGKRVKTGEPCRIRQRFEFGEKRVRSYQGEQGAGSESGKNLLEKLEEASKQLHSSKNIIRLSSLSKKSSTIKNSVDDEKLLRLYNNLYQVIRPEVLEALNQMDELSTCGHLKNKLLMSILVLAYRSAKKCHRGLQDEVQKLLDGYMDTTDVEESHSLRLVELINTYLKRSPMNQQILKRKAKEVHERVISTLENYQSLRRCSQLLRYAESALLLCWRMVVEAPSLVLFHEGGRFDPLAHERWHLSVPDSTTIKTFLWPGLLDSKKGSCLFKAIVIT